MRARKCVRVCGALVYVVVCCSLLGVWVVVTAAANDKRLPLSVLQQCACRVHDHIATTTNNTDAEVGESRKTERKGRVSVWVTLAMCS